MLADLVIVDVVSTRHAEVSVGLVGAPTDSVYDVTMTLLFEGDSLEHEGFCAVLVESQA